MPDSTVYRPTPGSRDRKAALTNGYIVGAAFLILVGSCGLLAGINMPKMDGFEFLVVAGREFGSDFAKVVIVMLTTSLPPLNVERARTYDLIRAHFDKPLENSHLQWIADTVATR